MNSEFREVCQQQIETLTAMIVSKEYSKRMLEAELTMLQAEQWDYADAGNMNEAKRFRDQADQTLGEIRRLTREVTKLKNQREEYRSWLSEK